MQNPDPPLSQSTILDQWIHLDLTQKTPWWKRNATTNTGYIHINHGQLIKTLRQDQARPDEIFKQIQEALHDNIEILDSTKLDQIEEKNTAYLHHCRISKTTSVFELAFPFLESSKVKENARRLYKALEEEITTQKEKLQNEISNTYNNVIEITNEVFRALAECQDEIEQTKNNYNVKENPLLYNEFSKLDKQLSDIQKIQKVLNTQLSKKLETLSDCKKVMYDLSGLHDEATYIIDEFENIFSLINKKSQELRTDQDLLVEHCVEQKNMQINSSDTTTDLASEINENIQKLEEKTRISHDTNEADVTKELVNIHSQHNSQVVENSRNLKKNAPLDKTHALQTINPYSTKKSLLIETENVALHIQRTLENIYQNLPWPPEIQTIGVYTDICGGNGDIVACARVINALLKIHSSLKIEWRITRIPEGENPSRFLSIIDEKYHNQIHLQYITDLQFSSPSNIKVDFLIVGPAPGTMKTPTTTLAIRLHF